MSFDATCREVRGKVLRLHVIAASDSEKDQQLKLKVRDAILKKGAEIFDGSVDIENAVEKITPQIDLLEHTAEEVIRKNGLDYTVKITIGEEYFGTRTSGQFTLPAGKYLA